MTLYHITQVDHCELIDRQLASLRFVQTTAGVHVEHAAAEEVVAGGGARRGVLTSMETWRAQATGRVVMGRQRGRAGRLRRRTATFGVLVGMPVLLPIIMADFGCLLCVATLNSA